MDELIKTLRHFITRDLVFLIGGGIVIGSFLHVFNNFSPRSTDHPVVFLLLAGVSYALGYAIQDGSGLIGLVRIAPPTKLRGIVKLFYKRITGQPWKDIDEAVAVDFGKAERSIKLESPEAIPFERIITLKQVGTTVGPCCLMASVIFLSSVIRGNRAHLLLAACAAGLGILLVFLSRVKGGQQAKALERILGEAKRVPPDDLMQANRRKSRLWLIMVL